MGNGEWGVGSGEWEVGISGRQRMFVCFSSYHFKVTHSSTPHSPLPTPHSPVSSCHHPWTAALKLIISCGHIFVPTDDHATSIFGISSSIYSLSSLQRYLVI